MELVDITPEIVASAPARGFKGRSPVAAAFKDWYSDVSRPILGLKLTASDDASLKDAICVGAGMQKVKRPKMENGVQVMSEKRGKPVFITEPFSSAHLLSAMELLGIEQRDLGSEGEGNDRKRTIAIVRLSETTVELADDSDFDDDDEDES